MIKTTNLVKAYNGKNVVGDLNLTIENGEVYGLLGPNGAGKSTTILMLLGLIQPTSGECTINGLEVLKNPIKVKEQIGYMPEDVGFYPNLTARENLDYFGKLYGMDPVYRKKRIDELLELVGLSDTKSRIGGYSKGMRQRLGIAKALLNDPPIIILDEPTANLDPKGVSEYRAIIREITGPDRTILIASHILSEVSRVCTKLGVLRQGKLKTEGTWYELTHNPNAIGLTRVLITIETRDPIDEISHPDIISIEYSD